MLLGGADVVDFPRFHTLCTKDLAEVKNPNREGFGFGLAEEKISVISETKKKKQ